MTEEFNIYTNLHEMMKCNILDKMKSMGAAKNSNEAGHNVKDEFDEFESMLNNNVAKSPPKRGTSKQNATKEVLDKKSKKGIKSRRSLSRERSISPPSVLLENLNCAKTKRSHTSAKTRRSVGKVKDATVTNKNVTNGKADTEVPTSSKKGRANRGGRGGNRGKARNTEKEKSPAPSFEDSFIVDDSSCNSCDNTYVETPNSSSAIMENFLSVGRQTRSAAASKRRSFVAEIAARLPTVDTIDLISSPFPSIQGSITLDSDGEVEEPISLGKNTSSHKKDNGLDISLDDDNPEISVKINWKGTPEAFKLRKYQKFSSLLKLLSEREGTVSENIVLNLNDHIITPDDTPESIGYKVFHFINGRVLAGIIDSPGVCKKQRNPNLINIKVQSDKWKRPLQIDMLKNDKFRILYIKCAEELNVGIEQIKLSFDGEHLDINDTPSDLDFEGGEAVDLRLK